MVSDALKFVLPGLILGFLLTVLHFYYLGLIFFILTVYICYFFRNPNRQIPQGDNQIVSPADGKVVKISPTPDGTKTISIFLSIFNVHVNRSPISGQLKELEYKRGKFRAAFEEEASWENEQNIITIVGPGIQIVVRQIAGLIARRAES
jgi:phosphatidylserine decarboxylase